MNETKLTDLSEKYMGSSRIITLLEKLVESNEAISKTNNQILELIKDIRIDMDEK